MKEGRGCAQRTERSSVEENCWNLTSKALQYILQCKILVTLNYINYRYAQKENLP